MSDTIAGWKEKVGDNLMKIALNELRGTRCSAYSIERHPRGILLSESTALLIAGMLVEE